MIADESKGYIFIRVPRTAGTSVTRALVNDGATKHYMHCSVQDARKQIPWFDDAFKFTIVRNPFERMVSWYRWCQAEGWPKMSFDKFVSEDRALTVMSLHTTQKDFLSINGNLAVDCTGRYEYLEDDWQLIVERFGIHTELEHVKSTGDYDYHDYYDDLTKAAIEKVFADDLEVFDYAF
jgi:hypothetical protein